MIGLSHKKPTSCLLPVKLILVLLVSWIWLFPGCAYKGSITQAHPPEFYAIGQKFPYALPQVQNPYFLVYGDSQRGWRFTEKFLKTKNWLTWKMLLFPFYEVYWLGNGIIGSINYLRQAPGYGKKEFLLVRDALYAEIQRTRVDFILNVGDLISDGRRPQHWETFLTAFSQEKPLLQEVPLITARGNHDRAFDPKTGLSNYEAIFPYPGFYTLDFPDLTVFVLDSLLLVDDYQYIQDEQQEGFFTQWFVSDEDSEQLSWLEKNLGSCPTKFKVVVMHHPPISFGKHFFDWTDPKNGRDLSSKRAQLLHVLQKNKVQIIFCGHEHFYQHSVLYPPVSTTTNFQSESDSKDGSDAEAEIAQAMHIIVAGSGGAPTRSILKKQDLDYAFKALKTQGFKVELIRHEEIYNYIRVSCRSDYLFLEVLQVTGDPDEPLRQVEAFKIE